MLEPYAFEIDKNKELFGLFTKLNSTHKIDIRLGGSLALILQGIINERKCGDLDISMPFFRKVPELNSYTKYDGVIRAYSNSGIKVDIFIDPTSLYFNKKVNNDWIKIQSYKEIMEAKLKYLHRGQYKHLQDLNDYFNFLEQKQLSYRDGYNEGIGENIPISPKIIDKEGSTENDLPSGVFN